MKNWEEQYNNIFGEKHHKVCEGKKCNCHKEVKQFIKDLRQKDRDEVKQKIKDYILEEHIHFEKEDPWNFKDEHPYIESLELEKLLNKL